MFTYDALDKVIKAYDIRGIVPSTLNEDVAEALGRAFGTIARAEGETTIAVGRDGRLSGPALSAALIRGLVASGVSVIEALAIGQSNGESAIGVPAALKMRIWRSTTAPSLPVEVSVSSSAAGLGVGATVNEGTSGIESSFYFDSWNSFSCCITWAIFHRGRTFP